MFFIYYNLIHHNMFRPLRAIFRWKIHESFYGAIIATTDPFITQIEHLLLLILEKRDILWPCEKVDKDIRSRYKILARESGDKISRDLHIFKGTYYGSRTNCCVAVLWITRIFLQYIGPIVIFLYERWINSRFQSSWAIWMEKQL
jgi:hypothetical protein